MKRFKSIKGHQYDTKTGLLWHKEAEVENWERAREYAKSLTDLGLKWRVPTIEELLSIVDYKKYRPATGLKKIESSGYWSSSTYINSTGYAWIVSLYDGNSCAANKLNHNFVRCVAGPEEFEYFKNRGEKLCK